MSSITSATRAQSGCTQLSSAQPNDSTMPTYLPITPYPTAGPPQLSITELTDRIDTCVQTYLSPPFLNSRLNVSSPAAPKPTSSHDSAHHGSKTTSQTLNLQKLAAAYSETCSLVWQQALTLSDSPPCAAIAKRSHTPQASAKPTYLVDFGGSPDCLTLSIQTLCRLWAIGKCHHPDAPFFAEAITLGSLQAKWQYPDIQNSLRRTTAHLSNLSPYNHWLMAYPTGWSYAVGRTMHQLLQWNYRLTPATFREFLILND